MGHTIRYFRSYRSMQNNDSLNENQRAFKQKAIEFVNNYFDENLNKKSKKIWLKQKQKNKDAMQQNQRINVLPFSKQSVIAQNDESQNADYLHITTTTNKKEKIDQMIKSNCIFLNVSTCPTPQCTPYICVNRSHFVKDDKNLKYIQELNEVFACNDNEIDTDSEFEEHEDAILDFIDDQIDENDLQRIFFLNLSCIKHRILSLSHHKKKLLIQQKNALALSKFDTTNKQMPIDSFSLLFCPKCCVYDCSLHGLDNQRRSKRALPSNKDLEQNLNYFENINEGHPNDQNLNDLAHKNGNYSSSNHMIKYLLPSQFKASVIFPNHLSECSPCSPMCYILYLRSAQKQKTTSDFEWNFMNLSNLRRLLNICKNNFCQIAAIFGFISCENVFVKALELMPSLKTCFDQQMEIKKNKKKKPTIKSAEDSFSGCQCLNGECQTNECECFANHRECDPNKCIQCQSYLPPDTIKKCKQWLLNNPMTTDCNVRISIDGIPNINPFALCSNLSCTHRQNKKLWIGKSDIHGFGCYAGESIKCNEFICEYLGEMVT